MSLRPPTATLLLAGLLPLELEGLKGDEGDEPEGDDGDDPEGDELEGDDDEPGELGKLPLEAEEVELPATPRQLVSFLQATFI